MSFRAPALPSGPGMWKLNTVSAERQTEVSPMVKVVLLRESFRKRP